MAWCKLQSRVHAPASDGCRKLKRVMLVPFIQGHSVQISDGCVDNMMTLYRLRCPSGCPPDDT